MERGTAWKLLGIMALVLVFVALSTCTDPRMLGTVELELRPRTLDEIASGKTIDEAARIAELSLKMTGRGYRFTSHKTIWHNGEEYPCRWIFAKNDYGEVVDILFVDMGTASALNMLNPNGPDIFSLDLSYGMRRIERINYNRNLGETSRYSFNARDSRVAANGTYMIYVAGTYFSIQDVGGTSGGNAGVPLDEENRLVRPDKTLPPTADDAPDPELPLYLPAEDVETQIAAMQEALENCGNHYYLFRFGDLKWGGKTYVAQRLFAVSEEGYSLTAVFSEDPELLYRLYAEREALAKQEYEMMRPVMEAYTARFDLVQPWNGYSTTFCDQFENGYGFIVMGHWDALEDCGIPRLD